MKVSSPGHGLINGLNGYSHQDGRLYDNGKVDTLKQSVQDSHAISSVKPVVEPSDELDFNSITFDEPVDSTDAEVNLQSQTSSSEFSKPV